MRYLVDTDWAVWWLRGRPEIIDRLKEFSREGLALSTISLAELVTGVQRSTDAVASERVLERFLRRVTILPFTEELARRFGEENARLQKTGSQIGDFDLAIAATALVHGLTLLTENRKHIERISGLQIESLKAKS